MDKGDSDDYTTDEYNNKKRQRDELGAFERSKRTYRSPKKPSPGIMDKFDIILNEIRDLKREMEEVKGIKDEVRQLRVEVLNYKNEVRELRTENSKIMKQYEETKKENEDMKNELKYVKSNIDIMEKKQKENNIVLTGVKVDTNDAAILKELTKKFFQRSLQIDIAPKKVSKIGEKTCVIEMNNEQEKKMIMENKYKLRMLRDERIFINDDLTRAEKEMRKEIRVRAQEEKSKGKEVKIGYRKITVDGQEWRWNRDRETLEKTRSKN